VPRFPSRLEAWTNENVVDWLCGSLRIDPGKNPSRITALRQSGLHGALLFRRRPFSDSADEILLAFGLARDTAKPALVRKIVAALDGLDSGGAAHAARLGLGSERDAKGKDKGTGEGTGEGTGGAGGTAGGGEDEDEDEDAEAVEQEAVGIASEDSGEQHKEQPELRPRVHSGVATAMVGLSAAAAANAVAGLRHVSTGNSGEVDDAAAEAKGSGVGGGEDGQGYRGEAGEGEGEGLVPVRAVRGGMGKGGAAPLAGAFGSPEQVIHRKRTGGKKSKKKKGAKNLDLGNVGSG